MQILSLPGADLSTYVRRLICQSAIKMSKKVIIKNTYTFIISTYNACFMTCYMLLYNYIVGRFQECAQKRRC